MVKPKFRSNNEAVAYKILREYFPNVRIVHDFPLEHGLKLDFLVRSAVRIGVEIDGIQHYAFCERFHRSRNDWRIQKARDKEKEAICKERGIAFVRLDARNGVDKDALIRKLDAVIKTHTKSAPKGDTERVIRNKEYRKKRYQDAKEWDRKRKNGELENNDYDSQ